MQPVSLPEELVISKLMGMESKVIYFLKQMKQQFPISLQERLEIFISENEKNKYNDKHL